MKIYYVHKISIAKQALQLTYRAMFLRAQRVMHAETYMSAYLFPHP